MVNVRATVPSGHLKPSHSPAKAIGWGSMRAMA
jgi:hypothetical protein